jgi:FkbM family methyltransferase
VGIIDIGINGGCHPCAIRLDLDPALPADSNIMRYVANGRFYEPDVSQVLLHVLREGDSFVDVGGNVGFFTTMAAALVGPAGRVLSFEPDPGNTARLRENLGLNEFANVTVVERPALAVAGPVDFYLNGDDSGGSALWDPGQYPNNTRTRLAPRVLSLAGTTIDAEVARLGLADVRLLKIDTEGAEHNVLRGAAELLAGARVPFVVCELHEFGLERMGSSQSALRAEMAGFGYETFALYYDGTLPRLVPAESRITTNYLCNILFSTSDAVGACWPEYLHEPGAL